MLEMMMLTGVTYPQPAPLKMNLVKNSFAGTIPFFGRNIKAIFRFDTSKTSTSVDFSTEGNVVDIAIPAGEESMGVTTVPTATTEGTVCLLETRMNSVLLEITDWGIHDPIVNFKFQDNLRLLNVPTVSPVQTDWNNYFYNCQELSQDLSTWSTSHVTDMGSLFMSCYNFNGNIDTWDTSNVTDMRYMFSECYAFNRNISNWDVGNVLNIVCMFTRANAFNQDLSGLTFPKVIVGSRSSYDSFAPLWAEEHKPQFAIT